ncbi:archease [Candidatus Saganbacteria bacterium]|nr:archease [Candidatus Saganbacteria bacterium]
MNKRFEIISHPSDVGLMVYGGSYQEVFQNAALGMFSLMAEIKEIETKETLEIAVAGEDREELFINWLNELIFLEDSKHLLLNEFEVYWLTDKALKARVKGEQIKNNLHELHRPIKAATYNQLEVLEKRAKVIFDV